MIARVLTIVWLTLVWILLWGTPSVANVAAGLLIAGILVALVPVERDGGGGIHPVAVLRFGVYFAFSLVGATLGVARTVLAPRPRLEQGVVAIPLRTRSPLVTAFVANSISLTPGTLTVDIRPRTFGFADADDAPTLFVHCLQIGDPDDIRRDGYRLERLAVAAFGTVADRDATSGPEPGWPRTDVGGGR